MRSTRVSALVRFGSVAAVAAVAVAGALAPVTAASAASKHHAHKAPTNILVKAHFVRGSQHKSDVINGLLRSRHHGVAGATIVLESRTAKTKFAVVASATTGVHGQVSFTVTPAAKTAYKLIFKGDATHRASHSAVIILSAPKKHKK
jgi:hypothetical protein